MNVYFFLPNQEVIFLENPSMPEVREKFSSVPTGTWMFRETHHKWSRKGRHSWLVHHPIPTEVKAAALLLSLPIPSDK